MKNDNILIEKRVKYKFWSEVDEIVDLTEVQWTCLICLISSIRADIFLYNCRAQVNRVKQLQRYFLMLKSLKISNKDQR